MFSVLQPNLVSRTKNMQKIISFFFFLSCVELVKPGGFSLNKLFKLLLLSVRAVHGQVFSKRCGWCLGWARLPHLPLPRRCGYFALTHPPPSCLAHPASWWAQCWLTGSTLQTMAQQWWVLSCRLSSRDPKRRREWGGFAAAGKSCQPLQLPHSLQRGRGLSPWREVR